MILFYVNLIEKNKLKDELFKTKWLKNVHMTLQSSLVILKSLRITKNKLGT